MVPGDSLWRLNISTQNTVRRIIKWLIGFRNIFFLFCVHVISNVQQQQKVIRYRDHKMLKNVCNLKIISVTRQFSMFTINFLVYVKETKTFPVQETESGIFYGLRYEIRNLFGLKNGTQNFSGFRNINWKNSCFHFNQKLFRNSTLRNNFPFPKSSTYP